MTRQRQESQRVVAVTLVLVDLDVFQIEGSTSLVLTPKHHVIFEAPVMTGHVTLFPLSRDGCSFVSDINHHLSSSLLHLSPVSLCLLNQAIPNTWSPTRPATDAHAAISCPQVE